MAASLQWCLRARPWGLGAASRRGPPAIAWAWELSTERLGFDPDRLWITAHLGDDEDSPMTGPERVLDLTPTPVFVSFQ